MTVAGPPGGLGDAGRAVEESVRDECDEQARDCRQETPTDQLERPGAPGPYQIVGIGVSMIADTRSAPSVTGVATTAVTQGK